MNDKIEYLDEERKKLWAVVRENEKKLNELINSTPAKLQQEARGQLNKASDYVNRINERKAEADAKLHAIDSLLSMANSEMESFAKKLDDFDNL